MTCVHHAGAVVSYNGQLIAVPYTALYRPAAVQLPCPACAAAERLTAYDYTAADVGTMRNRRTMLMLVVRRRLNDRQRAVKVV